MSTLLYDTPGPKARRRSQILSALSILVILLLLAWAGFSLDKAGMLAPDLWATVFQPDLLNLLAGGLLATFEVSAVAIIMSVVLGALVTAGLMTRSVLLRAALRTWVEVFRGLPLLLLIFFLFLGGPVIGVDISTFWALVLGLVLYNSAVLAEIFRAGIDTLPKGQGEAGLAIGLSNAEVFCIILLPQSIRRMLPTLLTQLITLLKETSFGFVIGYAELLRDARTAVEYLGGSYSLPVYTLVAVVYMVINCILSEIARRAQAVL
ncbi:ABC transporter permease subunit [Rhizobium sp. BK376]|uniref:ABC transporter permease subunit n=1 Tax=Rhizobium sp. BK376 TaxID=2512149 RepID=UPI00104B7348|nr:ABC transporter permease subunit [Rhizobium sp. BK376]TCR80187.1 amino acid ABC transporter membrane protein 2 (PAAT family) [Rhizobium sp. BK376]